MSWKLSDAPRINRERLVRLLIAPWAVYGIVYFLGLAAVHQQYSSAGVVALRSMIGALFCAAIIMVLDSSSHRSPRSLGVLDVIAIVIATLGWIVCGNAVIDVWHPRTDGGRSLPEYFSGATISVYVMLAWLALYFDDQSRMVAARAIQAAERAKVAAVEAQLSLLSARLNPHFLFNTLNSIRVLARQGKVDDTVRMIDGLASLLRASLEVDSQQGIELHREISMAEDYLLIQQVRFSDRLEYKIEVEHLAASALVPGMIIQPLIENAVVHGMRNASNQVLVFVRSYCTNGRLLVEVENDAAPGIVPPGSECVQGFGLSNVRERLQLHYPNNHSFRVSGIPGKVVAKLDLPLEWRK